MQKIQAILLALTFVLGTGAFVTDAEARKIPKYMREEVQADIPEGQREITEALERGRGLHFVEIKDVEVTRILADDNQGRRHQKWEVTLANGKTILAVYNLENDDRIPLKVGQIMSLGGQYIYKRNGGLIHWLHTDPRKNRPDGYVDLDGRRYGVWDY